MTLAVMWLFIGLVAAGQRGQLQAIDVSCTSASRVSLTFVAGPLNYHGVNPLVSCTLPRPSM
ncbi:hypothetical protein [Nocardioides sp.]|uniref:hypothetical protein n=1 Tax=Nocardioides sp. TaxID=35761 RepID=UPI0035643823